MQARSNNEPGYMGSKRIPKARHPFEVGTVAISLLIPLVVRPNHEGQTEDHINCETDSRLQSVR